MLKLEESKSGAFRIGGEIEVHRLGDPGFSIWILSRTKYGD